MAQKDCTRCDKKGFPVLLARYALGYGNMPDAIKNGVKLLKDMPLLHSTEDFYTLRTLCNGYVYLFDPSDKIKLRCFQVSSGANAVLTEIQLTSPAINDAINKKHESCRMSGLNASNTMRYGNAVLLTIPRANEARTVYVTFSSYFWNGHVAKINSELDNAIKYMTPIQVGGKNSYSIPIEKLSTTVFEYANKIKNKASWSQNELDKDRLNMCLLTDIVTNEANRLNKGKGVIIPVFDPASLCGDIDDLLDYKRSLTLSADDKSKLAYYGQLKELKTNLYTSAKSSAMQEEITYWKNIRKSHSSNTENGVLDILPELQYPKTIKRIDEKATKLGDENFNFYFKGIKSKNELENWYKNSIQSKYSQFYTNKVLVLDNFFIKLIKSTILEDYMENSFDGNDIKSGVEFTKVVTVIFGQMQQYDASYNYICSLLKGDITNKKNYILRALVWNQTKLIKTLSGLNYFLTDNPFVDKPWAMLLGARAAVVGKNIAALSESALLINTIDKSVANIFKQAATGQVKLSHLALAWGAYTNTVVSFLTIQGTHAEISYFFANYIQKYAGKILPPQEVQKLVELTVTEFMIAEGATDRPTKSNSICIMLQVSRDALRQFIEDIKLTGNFQKEGLKVILKNSKDFHNHLYNHLENNVKTLKAGAHSSYSTAKAAGVVQIVSIGVLFYRLLGNPNLDNQLNMAGASLSAISMALAMIDQNTRVQAIALEKALSHNQKIVSTLLIRGAAGAAIAGGIFFAVVDGRASYFAFEKGDNFLGTQYAVATILGSVATGTGVWALFRAGLTPNIATFVLTVAYIGLQYYIVKTKMEPIQKAIKISPWGIEPDNKSINQQNLNFQQLLKQLA